MREEELKYRVPDRRALDAVAASLGSPARVEEQRNRYFDTRDLALHGWGRLLRVRALGGGRTILTVKIAERIEAGLIVAEEEERDLSPDDVRALETAPGAFFDASATPLLRRAVGDVPPEALRCVGELCTRRRVYYAAPGVLALDEIAFPDGEEFEIELETGDVGAGRLFIERLCAAAGVRAWKECEPKTGRLFRRRPGSIK